MYTGPIPSSINKNFLDHSYSLITCLITGEQRQTITSPYLKKIGLTKEDYIKKFPGAPLISNKIKEARSNNMKSLNLTNEEFQKTRQLAVSNFLNSEKSINYRKNASEKAKKQHQNGQSEYVRKYFREKYIGSTDQFNRRTRLLNTPMHTIPGVNEKKKETYIKNSNLGKHNKETRYKKRRFKDTSLFYQSTYELDFLLYCETNNLLSRIKNSHCFSDSTYPYNFYEPDYILDDRYVIEIKSWYVEQLQEKKVPGLLRMKEALVVNSGYKFLYIRDKKYKPLESFLS